MQPSNVVRGFLLSQTNFDPKNKRNFQHLVVVFGRPKAINLATRYRYYSFSCFPRNGYTKKSHSKDAKWTLRRIERNPSKRPINDDINRLNICIPRRCYVYKTVGAFISPHPLLDLHFPAIAILTTALHCLDALKTSLKTKSVFRNSYFH